VGVCRPAPRSPCHRAFDSATFLSIWTSRRRYRLVLIKLTLFFHSPNIGPAVAGCALIMAPLCLYMCIRRRRRTLESRRAVEMIHTHPQTFEKQVGDMPTNISHLAPKHISAMSKGLNESVVPLYHVDGVGWADCIYRSQTPRFHDS
jgi:hypothetical protein